MKSFLQNVLLCCLFFSPLFGQNNEAASIKDVQRSGDNIIIIYNHFPIGDEEDAEYEVSIRLTREPDKNFNILITGASGDIGDGKFVGANRKITWPFKKQFPKGLPFDDLEFNLEVSKNTGVGSWVWYTGGAVLVGGGAAFFLLSKKDDETDGPLPDPPNSRPN